jgi:hypothetical protein
MIGFLSKHASIYMEKEYASVMVEKLVNKK